MVSVCFVPYSVSVFFVSVLRVFRMLKSCLGQAAVRLLSVFTVPRSNRSGPFFFRAGVWRLESTTFGCASSLAAGSSQRARNNYFLQDMRRS